MGLRRCRKAAGLSQTQLANIVGLSVSMISQLEKGEKSTSIASLLRLSDALGCSIEQLLDDDQKLPEALTEFLDKVKSEEIISQHEIDTLRVVRIPGYRLTWRAYAHILDAVRRAERLHS